MPNVSALIVKYRFDETSGDTIKDDGPNNLDAELEDVDEVINEVIFKYKKPKRTDGYKNNVLDLKMALEFTGEELLKIDHNQVLNMNNITVMAWVLYHNLDNGYKGFADEKRFEILEKYAGYWINIRTSNDNPNYHNKIRFGFANSNGQIEIINSTKKIPPDQWHHFAGTFDGEFLRIFIDGTEDCCSPKITKTFAHNAHPLIIGARMTDNEEFLLNEDIKNRAKPQAFFYGKIDEVRIYSEALTADDIKKIKNDTRPAAPSNLRIVSNES